MPGFNAGLPPHTQEKKGYVVGFLLGENYKITTIGLAEYDPSFWEKKKLDKVSFHFSVIYSARILGKGFFFSLPISAPLSGSLFLSLFHSLLRGSCVRSAGCL